MITHGRDGQEVGPQREPASWLEESWDHDQTASHRGELAGPTELGRGHRTGPPGDHPATLPGQPADHTSEPLYEQTRRAARLRQYPERGFPPDHGRS